MSLTLYYHPFSSYCWKALIALYENGTAFTPRAVNLIEAADAAALKALWPIGKFPVLRDDARGETIPESAIIVEYLAQHYPGRSQLIPSNADAARAARLADRTYDFYVMDPASKVIGDHFRPEGGRDAIGVETARKTLAAAYAMLERDMAGRTWATGEAFTVADVAAAPALFYANLVSPLAPTHPVLAAYLGRLMKRPSFTRVVKEALPTLMPQFPYGAQFTAACKAMLPA